MLSPHLSIGLLSFWTSVFLNWCSWEGFVVFLELLGLGLSENGTEKVFEWAIDCDDIDTESKNHRDDAIFLLQRWMLFNLLGNSHACYGAGVQIGKKCIYVRLLSGNWKWNQRKLCNLFTPIFKRQKMWISSSFFSLQNIIKNRVRVKLQRCSTNMNIKGRSRIRISRIYSNRGQTVWSCHPQFGEDFKNNYLQKKQFLPKSI